MKAVHFLSWGAKPRTTLDLAKGSKGWLHARTRANQCDEFLSAVGFVHPITSSPDHGDPFYLPGSSLNSCSFAPSTAASENASVNVLLLYQASQWSI